MDADEREITALALQSVDEPEQAEIDAAWDTEVHRRIDEIVNGGVERPPLVRSERISGFPNRIIDLVQGDEEVVVAYAHECRRPGYWRERLGSI